MNHQSAPSRSSNSHSTKCLKLDNDRLEESIADFLSSDEIVDLDKLQEHAQRNGLLTIKKPEYVYIFDVDAAPNIPKIKFGLKVYQNLEFSINNENFTLDSEKIPFLVNVKKIKFFSLFDTIINYLKETENIQCKHFKESALSLLKETVVTIQIR